MTNIHLELLHELFSSVLCSTCAPAPAVNPVLSPAHYLILYTQVTKLTEHSNSRARPNLVHTSYQAHRVLQSYVVGHHTSISCLQKSLATTTLSNEDYKHKMDDLLNRINVLVKSLPTEAAERPSKRPHMDFNNANLLPGVPSLPTPLPALSSIPASGTSSLLIRPMATAIATCIAHTVCPCDSHRYDDAVPGFDSSQYEATVPGFPA
jgi:hypothetical protein